MTPLEDLVQQCTVKITVPGGWGTGFFVAPGLILTCAHVVKGAQISNLQVQWQTRPLEATIEQPVSEVNDLALLRVIDSIDFTHPCIYLDGAIALNDALYSYGYPDDFSDGAFTTFKSEALTGNNLFIKVKGGQVRPGMSGSPLLNQQTRKVCGVVKFTRDRSSDLGGGAIPTCVILEQFSELRELQREFHGGDRRWSNLLARDSEINFQACLGAIARRSQKTEDWWDGRYVKTQAQLPLKVQPVKQPESPEQAQKQEAPQKFDVLAGLREFYRQEPVLLIGKPGSGKSTALRRLLLEEAQGYGAQEGALIPVLILLRSCDQGKVEDWISEALEFEMGVIRSLLKEQRLLLLFDGLNEVPNPEV